MDNGASNEKQPAPEEKASVEMGVDFSTGLFIIQMKGLVPVLLADGSKVMATVPAFQIPLPTFIQTAVNCMNQMLMKVAESSQAKSNILIAHPGQLPGDMRNRKH